MSEPLQIILIEDNKSDAHLIEEVLKDTGIEHRLIWLSDGEKALQYFETNSADFILLDLKLPMFSGHQLLDQLKKNGIVGRTPVVILTGSSSPDDRELAKEKGVVCYLVKPMTIEEMDRMTTTLKYILLGERSCDC
jgi:chemotaxis family two-component system response regulator Rcp1